MLFFYLLFILLIYKNILNKIIVTIVKNIINHIMTVGLQLCSHFPLQTFFYYLVLVDWVIENSHEHPLRTAVVGWIRFNHDGFQHGFRRYFVNSKTIWSDMLIVFKIIQSNWIFKSTNWCSVRHILHKTWLSLHK